MGSPSLPLRPRDGDGSERREQHDGEPAAPVGRRVEYASTHASLLAAQAEEERGTPRGGSLRTDDDEERTRWVRGSLGRLVIHGGTPSQGRGGSTSRTRTMTPRGSPSPSPSPSPSAFATQADDSRLPRDARKRPLPRYSIHQQPTPLQHEPQYPYQHAYQYTSQGHPQAQCETLLQRPHRLRRASADWANAAQPRARSAMVARPPSSSRRPGECGADRARKEAAEEAGEPQKREQKAAEHWSTTRGAGWRGVDEEEESRGRTRENLRGWRGEVMKVSSADCLLPGGLADYTFVPGALGRGKFSSVFLAVKEGRKRAVKHTALFPHHPLIASRLVREPIVMAELPPHPNLLEVYETVRTPGHFYLVEEYLEGYDTLEALLTKPQPMDADGTTRPPTHDPERPNTLSAPTARKIFSQLVSALRAIHYPLQVCHRDIKPENILVHAQTLQVKLLDFGLATHFSRSGAKLTTCCGSPAFHCPEIVTALASPPGTVSYWGPEVDIWTLGVTMLRVLTGARYPLGASHGSVRSMGMRARRALSEVRDDELRELVTACLDMNGERRMKKFDLIAEMFEAEQRETGWRREGEEERGRKRREFKSTSFRPTRPRHALTLPLLTPAASTSSRGTTPSSATANFFGFARATSPSPSRPLDPLTFLNRTHQPPKRIISFFKYALRCAGILFHTWPDPSSIEQPVDVVSAPPYASTSVSAQESSDEHRPSRPQSRTPSRARKPSELVQIFHCVLTLPPEHPKEEETSPSLAQSLLSAWRRTSRSFSTPPPSQAEAAAREKQKRRDGGKEDGLDEEVVRCLPFYMFVSFSKLVSPTSASRSGRWSASSSARSSPAVSRPSSRVRSWSSRPFDTLLVPVETHGGHFVEGTLAIAMEAAPNPELVFSNLPYPTIVDDGTGPSGASSPTRKNQTSRRRRRSVPPFSTKVFVEVTDERALPFVREALSIGGELQESSGNEDEGGEKRRAEGVGADAEDAEGDDLQRGRPTRRPSDSPPRNGKGVGKTNGQSKAKAIDDGEERNHKAQALSGSGSRDARARRLRVKERDVTAGAEDYFTSSRSVSPLRSRATPTPGAPSDPSPNRGGRGGRSRSAGTGGRLGGLGFDLPEFARNLTWTTVKEESEGRVGALSPEVTNAGD